MLRSLFMRLSLLLLVLVASQPVLAQDDTEQANNLIYVNAVAWSHDGSKIAAVGIRQPKTQGYLRIIDVDTGRALYQLDPNPGGFTSVKWSPDDRFIAAGSYDQNIWIIDVQNGTHRATLSGHQATVNDIDWSPDGSKLVSSGSWDGLVILWDMTTYQKIRNLEKGNLFPFAVAFSPDGTRIVIGGEGGMRIRSVNDEQLNPPWYFRELNVGAVAWSHDGQRIAFGTQTFASAVNPNRKGNAQVYVIDSNNGMQLNNFPTEDGTIYGLGWSPDDSLIASHSVDGIVRVWEVVSGIALESFPGVTQYPTGISFSPYGGRLAYGGSIPGDFAISATAQTDEVDAIQALANIGIQIVVPDPSLEHLQAIAEACNAPATIEQSLTASIETDRLTEFVAQVESLSADAIPPACRADLLAVAEALASR